MLMFLLLKHCKKIAENNNSSKKLGMWPIGTGLVLCLRHDLVSSSTEEKEGKSGQQSIIERKMTGVYCWPSGSRGGVGGTKEIHPKHGPQDLHLFMRPDLLKFLPLLNNTNMSICWPGLTLTHYLALGKPPSCCLTGHQNLQNKALKWRKISVFSLSDVSFPFGTKKQEIFDFAMWGFRFPKLKFESTATGKNILSINSGNYRLMCVLVTVHV